jgi:hypothetical protein
MGSFDISFIFGISVGVNLSIVLAFVAALINRIFENGKEKEIK